MQSEWLYYVNQKKQERTTDEDFPTLFYYYWLVIWTKSKPEQKKLAQRFVLKWCILSWKMGFSVRAVSLYDMINGPAKNVLMSGLVKLKNVL